MENILIETHKWLFCFIIFTFKCRRLQYWVDYKHVWHITNVVVVSIGDIFQDTCNSIDYVWDCDQYQKQCLDWFDNSKPLWHTIWHQRPYSTLFHAMACYLTAPTHYLYQYWLIPNRILANRYRCIFNMIYDDWIQLSISFKPLLPGDHFSHVLIHFSH